MDNDDLGLPDVAMAFTLSREQYEKYLSWREKLPKYEFADKPHYCFSFIPVGLIMTITVTRSDGHIINLC